MQRLTLSDTALDGATWLLSSKVFEIHWRNPGGDWLANGSEPYILQELTGYSARTLELDATLLVEHWLLYGNSGLHLRPTHGPASYLASRFNELYPIPLLIVDGKECPCIASGDIHPSAGWPTQEAYIQPTCLMRFDLSGVTSVTRAVLKLCVTNISSAASSGPGSWPLTYEINRLDMPVMVTDPAREIGGAWPPGDQTKILCHDDLSTDEQINQGYLVSQPISTGGWERIDGWLRCWFDLATRAVSWWKVFQPEKAASSPTKRPWGKPYVFGESKGYDELFMQYGIRIGEDVRDAFTEMGMKLPGLEGVYNLSGSGEYTLPMPTDKFWSGRLWHTRPSDTHPHLYRAQVAWYGEDLGNLPWSTRYFNRVNFLFKAGQGYTVEEQVKVNTINTDGSANSDGILRVWIDNVLCHEETDVLVRKHPSRQVQTGFVNLYHGGTKPPKARMHIDLRDVIFSTAYIGTQENEMADINTVTGKALDTLNECYVVSGQPNLVQQLSDAQAALTAANAKLASALALAQDAITADSVSDAAEAARLNALLASLQ